MDFKERCVVVKEHRAFEGDRLTSLDSVVRFAGSMCKPAGPDLEPNEELGRRPSHQCQNPKEDDLDIGRPETVSRMLRIANQRTSSVSNVSGLIPSFDA